MTLDAIAHWNRVTGELFAHAAFQKKKDPRDRVLGYIDLRKDLLQGEAQEYSCLLGTLVQETFATHPRLREACDAGISSHARNVARDIAAAKALHAPDARWDPERWRCSRRPRCRRLRAREVQGRRRDRRRLRRSPATARRSPSGRQAVPANARSTRP